MKDQKMKLETDLKDWNGVPVDEGRRNAWAEQTQEGAELSQVISFDTESHLVKRGQMVPRMVCLSFALRNDKGEIVSGLHARAEGITDASEWLSDDNVILVGHNIWYDLGLLCAENPSLISAVFDKIDKNLVRDTQVRQMLIDNARGQLKFTIDDDTGEITKSSYHLSDLSYRLLKKFLKKKDTWRLKYALLDGVPLDQWPEEASKYAIDDAVTTLEVFEAQDKLAGVPLEVDDIPNSAEQHKAAWALYLMSTWGLRTDGESVAKLKSELEADLAKAMDKLRTTDLIKQVKKKGVFSDVKDTKVIKARVEKCFGAKGLPVPKTEPSASYPDGQTSTARKFLVETGDEELKLLAEAGATGKLLNTYVPVLESGTRVPINPRYNVMMETGRTSCTKPNIQNPPRAGGVRTCFVPRPGNVFVFSDYDTLELRSLAQACLDILGRSSMADALRRGEDLHLSLAAKMLDIPLDEAKKRFDAGDAEIKEYRQQAKPANFGFPGGMAAESFREYAEGYGIKLSSEKAAEIHDAWFKAWPEMRDYFSVISKINEEGYPVVQLRSNRMRGGAGYCAIANGFFQGLAADLAKEALWRVARECYIDEKSALFGCRPALFLHDEIGMEVPYDKIGPERASAAADRLSQVMIESASPRWIPDVPITCKPVMVRRWYKGSEQVRMRGLLVPCKPVTTEKDGKKKTQWVADL